MPKRFALALSLFLLVGCAPKERTVASPDQAGPSKAERPRVSKTRLITTELLLEDLVDLRRLTELPVPAYTQQQASSYDRASKTPDDAQGWFANGDSGQFIRQETNGDRKEFVMMDADGPGAIVRIWSANPEGNLRVYLDGAEKPVIEAPMNVILGGKHPGLPRPIAGEYARGWNLYFPITYAKHCKVTSDKGGFYYHVNYRTYEAGSKVETFTADLIQKLETRIADIGKRLDSPREGGGPPADRVKKPFDVTVSPGKQLSLVEVKGKRTICGLLFHIVASDLNAAARETVLRIAFDGETTVECPLGDFYGSSALVPYDSLPLGVTEKKPQDLWCHWWMPFEKIARISVVNFGRQTVTINGRVATVPNKWTDRMLRFHARWRIQRDIPARPFSDWTHLDAKGVGRFVGGSLHIVNNNPDWWGEGDEKIYVDGEKFPSTFGTGTEDYYGYAWCSPDRFVHAYHNQPATQGPRNYGNSYVNRFHVIDDIPFTKSFKFDLENWPGTSRVTAKTTRAAVSYWYARPDATDFFKPITAEDVRFIDVPAWKGVEVAGAGEAERMKAAEKTGTVEVQGLGEPYSRDQQLWWHDAKLGDKLVLRFPADTEGKKRIIAKLTKAKDYGIHQLSINGQKAGKPIDLYSPDLTQIEVDLGEFEVKPKGNTLTVEIVGTNPKADPKYMFGIDYLLVK